MLRPAVKTALGAVLHHLRLFVFALALFTFTTSAWAGNRPPQRLVMLWVDGELVGRERAKLASHLRDVLRDHKSRTLGVGSREALGRVLQQRKLCRPTESGCDARTAHALDATHFIKGHVHRNADGLVLEVRLFRAGRPVVEVGQATTRAANVAGLHRRMRDMGRELADAMGKERTSTPPPDEQVAPPPATLSSAPASAKPAGPVVENRILYMAAVQVAGQLRIEDGQLKFITSKDSPITNDFSAPLHRLKLVTDAHTFGGPGITVVVKGELGHVFVFGPGQGARKDAFKDKLQTAVHAAKTQRRR